MVEIVASLSTQMIYDLSREEKESVKVMEIADQVMALVSVRRNIQHLLNNGHSSEKVLNSIETIRYLAYKIEDVLETCAAEVAFMFQKNDEERCVRRFVRRYFSAMNDGIKIIRAKISNIESDVDSFCKEFPDDVLDSLRKGEQPKATDRIVRWPRQMYRPGSEDHFVGMEDEVDELVSLVAKKEEHRIISILGAEGSGKTTVARRIYNHPEVRRCFKAFAWVSLGPDCQNSIVLQEILRQLGPGKVKENRKKKGNEITNEVNDVTEEQEVNEIMDEVNEVEEQEVNEIMEEEEEVKEVTEEEQNMIDQLKEIQKQKSCLIVLDSICDIEQWKQISSGFQMQDAGTRIMLTTRYENIAKDAGNIAKDVGFTHKLRLLSEDEGWELLRKHAFPRKSGPDFGLFPRLGKQMVRKCDFLPLKISSLGRNLREKISLSEWQMVSNDVAGYLQRDYHNEGDESVFSILDSRYEHLPYYLKQCFLYLGIFSKDEDIDAEDLSFLWMAEGMVASVDHGRERAMDRAEDYLGELADSGMLQMQVDELSPTRRLKLFRLHNRARELALYQGQKEDFRLKILDFCDGNEPIVDTDDHPRRLVIHFDKQVNFWADDLVATDQLRSLLFLNSDQKYEDIPLRIPDFAKFKLLRVLHFLRCKFEGRKLPKGIDKLVNLRYIGLLYCDLDELPLSIGNLRNLNVLYVRVHDAAQTEIPNVLSQMVLLKHLHLPHYSDREQINNKLMLGDLLELETLVGFNSLIHDLSGLSNLQKLRHLVAHAYSNDSLTSMIKFVMYYGARVRTNLNIENRCNFTTAEGSDILEEVLMCPNLHALTLSMVLIYKIPDCGLHVSPDLTQIKLIGCRIKEDPMEALAKFPKLQKLCFGYGAFVGKEMTIRNTGFPTLEYLEFRGLPNLKELRVDEGALCNLSALTVKRCPKLEKIPDGLTSISGLKKLEVELAPEALTDHQEKEYHDKFAFVNSFIIRKLDPFSGSNNDQ